VPEARDISAVIIALEWPSDTSSVAQDPINGVDSIGRSNTHLDI